MIRFKTIGYFLVSMSAAACSSSAGDSGSTGAEASAVSDEAFASDEALASDGEQLLNRFSYQDLQLSFYWMGPGSVESQEGNIGVEQNFVGVDYVSALRQEYGPVTALELFKAFAPAGMEPHPALIAQHEGQALAYGRSGAELEVRELDGDTLSIDKAIPANCTATVLPNQSPLFYFTTLTRDVGLDGVYFFLCADSLGKNGSGIAPTSSVGCAIQSGAKLLTVGICNDTASINPTEFWTQRNDIRGNFSAVRRANVAPGGVGRFDELPIPAPFTAFNHSLGVIGRNSTANTANAHRQVMGIGS
jgi:hypothetical protein